MMWTSIFILVVIITTIFANPLTHGRGDVITTRTSIERSDDFNLDNYNLLNDDLASADIIPQGVISDSDINLVGLSDTTVADADTETPTEVPDTTIADQKSNINGPVEDCLSEHSTSIDQDPTRKRSVLRRGNAVCPPRRTTQAPSASFFDRKTFTRFLERLGRNTQREHADIQQEQPDTQRERPLDERKSCPEAAYETPGSPYTVLLSCGGPKVQEFGSVDYVLNCVPGRCPYPTLSRKC